MSAQWVEKPDILVFPGLSPVMLVALAQLLTMSSFIVKNIPVWMINYMLTQSLGLSNGARVTSGARTQPVPHTGLVNPLLLVVSSDQLRQASVELGTRPGPRPHLAPIQSEPGASVPLRPQSDTLCCNLSLPGRPLIALSSAKHTSFQPLTPRISCFQF